MQSSNLLISSDLSSNGFVRSFPNMGPFHLLQVHLRQNVPMTVFESRWDLCICHNWVWPRSTWIISKKNVGKINAINGFLFSRKVSRSASLPYPSSLFPASRSLFTRTGLKYQWFWYQKCTKLIQLFCILWHPGPHRFWDCCFLSTCALDINIIAFLSICRFGGMICSKCLGSHETCWWYAFLT